MNNAGWVILYVLIFLLCLSFVVSFHEAGHFLMAKLFHVYCYEFSVGFGHPLFRKRLRHRVKNPLYVASAPSAPTEEKPEERPSPATMPENKTSGRNAILLHSLDGESVKKKAANDATRKYLWAEGETYFALRVLPLGGYVSMAGEEGDNNPDGIQVPKERTLTAQKPWKQILIMLAGITMNFLLAYFLFFLDYACVPQTQYHYESNAIQVDESRDEDGNFVYPAAGVLETGDKVIGVYQKYEVFTRPEDSVSSEKEKVFYFPGDGPEYAETTSYLAYDGEGTGLDHLRPDCVSYAVQDLFAHGMQEERNNVLEKDRPSYLSRIDGCFIDGRARRTVYLKTQKQNGEIEENRFLLTASLETDGDTSYYLFGHVGFTCLTSDYRMKAGEAFLTAGRTFGSLFVELYQAIFSIFTPSGWSNLGGIISVYEVSTSGLKSRSVEQFLFVWAYISLNLGCFNLLPFPGLDGWQTLIALVEWVLRRKISPKAKSIANGIGLALLLAFAAVLLVKDILRFL